MCICSLNLKMSFSAMKKFRIYQRMVYKRVFKFTLRVTDYTDEVGNVAVC